MRFPSLDDFVGNFQVLERKLPSQIIRGSVGSTGTPINGRGYTVAYLSTGVYTVNFDDPFESPPVVVLGVGNVGGLIAVKQNGDSTVDLVPVQTYNPSTGAFVDARFNFIAMD